MYYDLSIQDSLYSTNNFSQKFVALICQINYLSLSLFTKKSREFSNFQIAEIISERMQTAEDDAFCPESVKIQDGT